MVLIRFVRIACLLILSATLVAAVEVGSDKDEVIKAWGFPKSSFAIGKNETLMYQNNVEVYLANGKVTGFKNRKLMPDSGAAPAASAPPVTVGAGGLIAPLAVPDLSSYPIPAPTIYNDPNYRVAGTWGGESDGKLIGIDGKPLADHKQYANDTSEFLTLFRRGISLTVPEAQRATLDALFLIYRARSDPERADETRKYQARYQRSLEHDPLNAMAAWLASLDRALSRYRAEEGQLNFEESLRVGDRVDLNDARNDQGRERRQAMKAAVWEMEQYRKALMGRYASTFETAFRAKVAEDARAAAQERFAVIAQEDAQMFLYGSFERTPMLEGLAQASEGKVYENAKPLLLPKGARVQVLKSTSVNAPAKGDRQALQLKVSQIKIKDPNVRQLDGAKLNATFNGWVLDSALAAAR